MTCDVAGEASWDALGEVTLEGTSLALAGEPRQLGGHARDRYVYAPCAGVFRTALQIGDAVSAGQPVATIQGVMAGGAGRGILRGLTHGGVRFVDR